MKLRFFFKKLFYCIPFKHHHPPIDRICFLYFICANKYKISQINVKKETKKTIVTLCDTSLDRDVCSNVTLNVWLVVKAEEVTVKLHIPIGKAGSGCKGPDVSIEHYCLKLQWSPYGILDNDTFSVCFLIQQSRCKWGADFELYFKWFNKSITWYKQFQQQLSNVSWLFHDKSGWWETWSWFQVLSSVDFQQNSQHDVQRDIDVGDGGKAEKPNSLVREIAKSL